jgi:hypothetical protein
MKLKSWELWHSLFHHPLLNAPLMIRHFAPRRFQKRRLGEASQIGIATLILIAASVLCLSTLSATMSWTIRLFGVLMTGAGIGLLLAISILPGMNLALKVSGAIFDEQAKGRYDLLALTPKGLAALHWTLVMRCMRDDLLSRRLRQFAHDFGALFLIPIIAALLPVLMMAFLVILFNFRLAAEFFALVGMPLVVIALVYVDYIQSLIIAALISVIVPIILRSRGGISWLAPLLFVVGQGLFYMGFIAFFTRLYPLLTGLLPPEISGVALFIEAIIGLALIFALRELIVALLWRIAKGQFEDDLSLLRID